MSLSRTALSKIASVDLSLETVGHVRKGPKFYQSSDDPRLNATIVNNYTKKGKKLLSSHRYGGKAQLWHKKHDAAHIETFKREYRKGLARYLSDPENQEANEDLRGKDVGSAFAFLQAVDKAQKDPKVKHMSFSLH